MSAQYGMRRFFRLIYLQKQLGKTLHCIGLHELKQKERRTLL
jgi:hypothetical protein